MSKVVRAVERGAKTIRGPSTQQAYPVSRSNVHYTHWRSRAFSFTTAKASERRVCRRHLAFGNVDLATAAAIFSR